MNRDGGGGGNSDDNQKEHRLLSPDHAVLFVGEGYAGKLGEDSLEKGAFITSTRSQYVKYLQSPPSAVNYLTFQRSVRVERSNYV